MPMKKTLISVVTAIVVLMAVCVYYKKPPADLIGQHSIHSTTIVQLITNPNNYEGKYVSFYGLLSTNSKLFPSIYINEHYAKVNDWAFSILITSNSTITIQDQQFNNIELKSLDAIDGCFVNISGYVVDGTGLKGGVTIIIDDECKQRFSN